MRSIVMVFIKFMIIAIMVNGFIALCYANGKDDKGETLYRAKVDIRYVSKALYTTEELERLVVRLESIFSNASKGLSISVTKKKKRRSN